MARTLTPHATWWTATWDDLEALGIDNLDPDTFDLAEQQTIADLGRLTPKTTDAEHVRYWNGVARHYFRIVSKREEATR